jgi:hypothetical protein
VNGVQVSDLTNLLSWYEEDDDEGVLFELRGAVLFSLEPAELFDELREKLGAPMARILTGQKLA